jgi:YihY family inner membrane protein
MNRAEKLAHSLDRLQQRKPWLAFPVAVWKKFGDDQAGNLAALIAYYAFASLFPLLLVFVTVLDIVLRDFPSLRGDLISSVIGQFPVAYKKLLEPQAHALRETGPALVVGIIFTFLGARGGANAAQNALNQVWGVPFARRPGFPWSQLRSLGLVVAVGLGVVLTSLLSTLAADRASALLGPGARDGAIALSLALNIGVFWLGFRLATARTVSGRELLFAAVLSAITWQVLQLAGGYIIKRQLHHASLVYGGFALLFGLMAWLYLQAQFTLFALEAAVVRARKLWPRSLAPPPLTQPDLRAYTMYAMAAQRRLDQEIKVSTRSRPPGEVDGRGTGHRSGRPPPGRAGLLAAHFPACPVRLDHSCPRCHCRT